MPLIRGTSNKLMNRKTSIALFIIVYIALLYIIIAEAIVHYVLVVAPFKQYHELELADLITGSILIKLCILAIFVLLTNYFYTITIMANKKPFLTRLTITSLVIVVLSVLVFSTCQSFSDYRKATTQLQQYMNGQTITEAEIITKTDTIEVKQLHTFITDIGLAKYKDGPRKYFKTMKVLFTRTDGSKDSLYTNGQVFGSYHGKYFAADSNIMYKYLANGKRNSN